MNNNLDNPLVKMVQLHREKEFEKSDQMSLGDIIKDMENIVGNPDCDEDTSVWFDFEYLFPTRFNSWRGLYRELAIGFDAYPNKKNIEPMTVTNFLAMCKETVGKTFTGYKGGEFEMSLSTPVWVANYGNSGNTAVIGVYFDGYNVMLITGYRDPM